MLENQRSTFVKLFLLIPSLGLLGCGGSDVELINLTGTVTLDGQVVPGPGTLYFTPSNPADGHAARPGTANFDAGGNFDAGSFKSGDGLRPGEYKIAVHCWEIQPTMEGPPAKSFIPQKYSSADTSGLTCLIESGKKAAPWIVELKSEQ